LSRVADAPAGCELLAWDSEFWGFTVARVLGDHLAEVRVDAVDAWCAEQGVRCLYFLAASNDPVTTLAAERGGFHLSDVRLTFRYDLASDSARERSLPRPELVLRSSTPDDLPWLEALARVSYRDTRFYYDQHFSRERCAELYATWIRKSCAGWADIVLVIVDAGEPRGYLSCHLEVDRGEGRIGLVGVHPLARGLGLGTALVNGAQGWFRQQGAAAVTVVTQGRNTVAQRLYQQAGFRTEDCRFWYHKWYAERE
jgi:dTDP-4-amino-4,6-dideoxy-D-galactose acyltransferase